MDSDGLFAAYTYTFGILHQNVHSTITPVDFRASGLQKMDNFSREAIELQGFAEIFLVHSYPIHTKGWAKKKWIFEELASRRGHEVVQDRAACHCKGEKHCLLSTSTSPSGDDRRAWNARPPQGCRHGKSMVATDKVVPVLILRERS